MSACSCTSRDAPLAALRPHGGRRRRRGLAHRGTRGHAGARRHARGGRPLDLPATARWLIVTYHPVTLEYRDTAAHVDALVAALEKTDATLLVTYPNADTAGVTIIERLEEFAARCARVRLVRNLGDDLYLSMLAAADAMVGNSSSGLIEAPSFALPVVNVGRRQQGRLRGANVIDVGDATDEILAGLET